MTAWRANSPMASVRRDPTRQLTAGIKAWNRGVDASVPVGHWLLLIGACDGSLSR